MVLLILGALAVPIVLGYSGVIGWPLIVGAEIGILLFVGWRFDRGRALGARDPYSDANRADLASPIAMEIPPLPKEAFELPRDRPKET